MEYETVIQFINGVGFPITCCIALFYQNSKQDERYDKQMKELSKVIENNSSILLAMCGKLGVTPFNSGNGVK